MRMTVACHAALVKAKGAVVNIASMHAIFGAPLSPAYAASKGGVVQLTKSLAVAWAEDGIRVNAIAPGEIDTAILSPGTEEIVDHQIPMHRLGTPDEVAKIIYVLCTETASYVNGAEIHINGGQHV
jgi:NAD(P)-dependent dehydrogenase (short-subunit alcohol dehydrogenase family)